MVRGVLFFNAITGRRIRKQREGLK